ncbi:uncharacterized protein LOC110933816 [Helianthus annuus]|uniref:uncharacterized protein LOC110933816 n=1 Tax=Helianthus annuus TaxID=4232 RepID=UPI000B8EEA90|nr:uncharacterized protein LOC110933816 [Helianthus annuus]
MSDELSLAQEPVKEEDLIVHILNQLGDEYGNIVATIKSQDTAISYPELFDKLVDFERSIEESDPTPVMTTVNYTQRNNRPPNCNPLENRSGRSLHANTSRPNRASWPAPNRNNGSRPSRHSLYCQFCSIPGHDTKDCGKLAQFLRDNNINKEKHLWKPNFLNF